MQEQILELSVMSHLEIVTACVGSFCFYLCNDVAFLGNDSKRGETAFVASVSTANSFLLASSVLRLPMRKLLT